jgi:citrate lyase subunit beta / citryl-CoA lyase
MTGTRSGPSGLRSFLFAPGNHARRVEKVFLSGADAVILDLEDTVPVAEKESTRALVVSAMRRPRRAAAYIRVNAFESRWCMADLEAVAGPWIDGIVLPKTESADQVRAVGMRLSERERAADMKAGSLEILPIVETAKGVEAVAAIVASGPRVRRIALGGADYTHDVDLVWTPSEEALSYARARIAHASRVAGLDPPVDTVVLEIRDSERFRQSARNGRMHGFAGKLCIHPDQVPLCHEVFSPSADELAHARKVIDAFQAAEAAGSASIQVDGRFIDYPMVDKARRVVALAERIAGRRLSVASA